MRFYVRSSNELSGRFRFPTRLDELSVFIFIWSVENVVFSDCEQVDLKKSKR